MIPIQIDEALAEEHYKDIKGSLLYHIKRVLDDGGIQKRPKNVTAYWISYSHTLKSDLESFLNDPDTNLKPIIVQSPDSLIDTIIDLYLNKFTYINKTSNDYKILYNIFVDHSYKGDLDKLRFTNRIKVDTCCYCNRNYIFTSTRNKKIKPEIDHFYPKEIYPILGVTYFNLIPTCETCNGQACKHNKDPFSERLINPYLLKNDDFLFGHRIKNISIINPLIGKSDLEIYFKTAKQSHLDIFNLRDLYELHYDHGLELVVKKRIKYSKKYRDYLNSYKGLSFNKTEIDRIILGNYSLEKEQHKRPLSKLYQDLGKELGLI